VRRTFERRRTPIPEILPIGLDDTFWREPERPAHVRAFARRARITTDVASARALAQTVREFLWPVLQPARSGHSPARQSHGAQRAIAPATIE
jgi:hypothetical protein